MRKIDVKALGFEDCLFDAYVMDGSSYPDLAKDVATQQEWLDFRQTGIGGSDVSTIMGINKYKSPLKLFLEKVGKVEPDDLSEKEAVEWGNRLEDTIRVKFRENHPEFEVRVLGASLVSRERPWAHANLDGRIYSEEEGWGVLEIKTVGRNREHDWDDGVPDYYVAQVTHYLSVTGWSYAYVAALIGGQHYVEYRIDRDEQDVADVNEVVDFFWNECVAKGMAPELTGNADESAALLDMYGLESQDYVQPMNVPAFDKLVSDYQEAKAREKAYADEARRKANEIRGIIGSAKGAVSDVYMATWVKSVSSRFDAKRFRDENPDLAGRYTATYMRDGGLRVTEVKR